MAVPEDATGAVFVRRQDSLIHLDDKGQQTYTGYRVRILHPNALQMGNLALIWNPAFGAPTVHAVRVYRGSDVIDVLKTTAFEVLRREDQLEAARLDGNLTAILRISDLRVGDELEVSYTVRASDPTLGRNDAGMLILAPDPAPGRYRLGLSWDEGSEPAIRESRDMAAVAQKGEHSVEFRFDNPPVLNAPKDAPPRFGWLRVAEFSDFPDWQAISSLFAPLYAKAAQLPGNSPLKQEAARILAQNSTPLDRAGAALKLVQQDVRYIYIGLNSGNLTPATAEETWQRRYGDCKGKTALLLALLKELGIEAEPVLVNTAGMDDGLDERLPNPGMFDHVLVRARIEGKSYWLDGTMPAIAPPSADLLFAARWALPLRQPGTAIERLPRAALDRPDAISLVEMDARAGFDQPARIINTTILRGIDGVKQQVQLSGLTHDQLLNGFRQQLVGGMWGVIEDVRWRYDVPAQASVLTITGTGPLDWEENWENAGKRSRSLSLPGGGFSPPERRTRPADQDQSLPYYTARDFNCRVTTLRIPAATEAKDWSYNTVYDVRLFGRAYHRAFELRDGAIRMVRSSRIETEEVDAVSVKRDNAQVGQFDNSMAWVYHDPGSPAGWHGSGQAVPATYDIDWTVDSAACLPAAAGK
ncbi:DUF3857 domain-containing protein [Novosphingobium colocasiae]|uniref:DUF3857 domain-containing protein n=1 Tax=Novosphingobium colocasiae TaxID=1256513 RepID=UPI0035B1F05E